MSQTRATEEHAELTVDNIGGIDRTEIALSPGVTTLTGRNATNRVIDSLEALDSDRIAVLVEYFDEYAEYLVVALLPEDAAALGDQYRRVTEI